MMIIAFTGKKFSGKSTAAEFLCKEYNFVEYMFAEPLKRGLATTFGWTYNSFLLTTECIMKEILLHLKTIYMR